MNIRQEDVLDYHASEPPGKISVTPTKPCHTQRDLSLAYTPGVAIPCLFGYNYLNTRAKEIGADQRVFADEFVARIAETYC